MKTLLSIVIVAFLSALFITVFPWWCSSIVACIVVFAMRNAPGAGFLAGFVGVALAWGVIAGWIDLQNAHLLSGQIGKLFGGISSVILVLLTAALGGLTGGLGGLTGALIRRQPVGRQT